MPERSAVGPVTLWLRARHVPALVLGILALAVLLRLVRGHVVVVPAVLGGGATAIPWSVLVHVLLAALLSSSFDARAEAVEHRPVRNIAHLDVTLFSCCALGYAVLGGFVADGVAVVAPAALLSGLAVMVTVRWSGSTASLVSTLTLLLTCSYGTHLAGARFVRFLEPDGNTIFASMLALLATAGAVVALLGGSEG